MMSQPLDILVLANPYIHLAVQAGLALVTRRIEVVDDAQALLIGTWKRIPDLVVIEVATPAADPAALCLQLRRYFPSAILIVEVGASEAERIGWLDSGADEVLRLAQGGPAEIAARSHALIRRLHRQRQRDPGAFLLHALGMRLDIAERRLVLPDGRRVDLNANLTRLLAILFSYGESVVPATVLSQQLFQPVPADAQRRLSALTRDLAGRFAQLPPPTLRVECVRGAGYRLALVQGGE